MQLVNPGFWTVIGFLGIVLVAIGATFIALSGTHKAANSLRYLIQEEVFGSDEHRGLKTLVEDETALSEGPEFEELKKVITRQHFIELLDLPLKATESLSEIGYETYNVNGHFLYVVKENGEILDRKINASYVEEEIDRIVVEIRKEEIDRVVRWSWFILLCGFTLQGLSYFTRYFVLW